MNNNKKHNYRDEMLRHLALYKIERLGIHENGIWKRNRMPYPHILPEALQQLNILEPFRKEFLKYLDSQKGGLRLHSDFHHLNSSQAMCFNLFFPLVMNGHQHINRLLTVLGVQGTDVVEFYFEKVLDPKEETNFDFFIRFASGRRLLFELKLTEGEFASVKADPRHKAKHADLYRQRIAGKLNQEYQDGPLFFHNYQLIRNISYLRKEYDDVLFVIFPKRNDALAATNILAIPSVELRDNVKLLHLEHVVAELLSACRESSALFDHYKMFKEKYINIDEV